ncbi:16S rRNA (adenine(1518)-N(6)/adenine(1519)-N(6))-dimethyltransferase RsmA [Desulfosarcina sp. OttesenSCG-928-G10]|nr:16S rRNA (adenine(1518)-N(6)/adenine(1519)-N(6))-dimethyltransferase RsmA [Desulfosarcina sp. OttesenSCG-928-G10]MDL2321050.1 16S rRNA (adenine(1518)-N(6)/adenine(1519)-N(6))-dimethyltransferase RsmA [Desulfosarcina sp. OttesenSCG-928-B08]
MTAPRTLLTAWNVQAKKQLGQNFLNDPGVAAAIVDLAKLSPDDVVLEIGPGLGAITLPASRLARRVIAVDKDDRIIELLQPELAAAGALNVDVRQGDILKTDIPAISREAGASLVVLGNLPYNISSQVVVQLIQARQQVRRAVLMLQKEMAERITAPPGSRTYGRLSVMLGYCARTRIGLSVPASRFFPAPKVDSTVLTITFVDPPPFPAQDEALLFRVVRAAFGKRRKTLRNALSQSDLALDPAACEKILVHCDIDPMERAEQLPVSAFVRLANEIGKQDSGVSVQ